MLHRRYLLIFSSIWLGLMAALGLLLQGASLSQAAAPIMGLPKPASTLGFDSLRPQAQITPTNPVTPLDIVIVFDVSGSMEDQTICHDCWVRTSYNPNYPNNGYFNPLPYNPAWATAGTGNQSISQSSLCTVYPPQPFLANSFQYLTVEAELYSRNVGNWGLEVRTPGQGFWALQRGSKPWEGNLAATNALGEDADQRTQAGNPAGQSSNVCRPNVTGGLSPDIDCTVGGPGNLGDNVCSSADGGIAADCSAYIATRPFETYGQMPGSLPYLNGAAYNADCFTAGALSGACWSGSPFNTIPGLDAGPSNVPWVEYDFTPTWNGNTYIWIRAIGGGEQSYTWAGSSPDQIQPDLNGGGVGNNVTPWRKVVYWQVNNGPIYERKDNANNDYQTTPAENYSGGSFNTANNTIYHMQRHPYWRDSRAINDQWRWIRLNDDDGTIRSINVVSGTQYTLKLYQGSAGYMIDKIVFTNDNTGSTPERGAPTTNIPAALQRDANGNTATNPGDMLGPPASPGSATREACNRCNPAYGYTVNPAECSCKRTPSGPNDFINGGCTPVFTTTNQLQTQLQTGLYSGLQPLRSAQEAIKNFAAKLNPQCHQLGVVPFTGGSDNNAAQSDPTRRSKLQCLRWATNHAAGGVAECYDANLFTAPISYTHVLSAVEKHWPEWGTNIASGMREGLEELGLSTPGNPANSNCTGAANDGSACDRQGAARRVMILMTDGLPNDNPGNCAPGSGRPDLWDGLIAPEDADLECAVYYAYLAAQNNVTVYTIGIGAGPDPDLLTAIATGVDPRGDQPDVVMFAGTSGQYFPAAKPGDLNGIFDYILSQTGSDCGSRASGGQISALNYTVFPGENLPIRLENHLNTAGPYDIYLGNGANSYKICTAVNTDLTNAGDFLCAITTAIPSGFYDLYSTLTGSQVRLAVASQQVEVGSAAYLPVILKN